MSIPFLKFFKKSFASKNQVTEVLYNMYAKTGYDKTRPCDVILARSEESQQGLV